MLPVSLSRGALIAILACIFVLLGELVAPCLRVCAGVGGSPHALNHESVNPLSQLLSIGLLPKPTSKGGRAKRGEKYRS